jgi:predicted secreted hydrolase
MDGPTAGGPVPTRRRLLALPALGLLAGAAPPVRYPVASPGVVLTFPHDHGAHPDFRTEWWYLTARVRDATGAPLGVQVTFFRHRPGLQEGSRSRFAPTQLLFAHAAIADPRSGRLLHDQRAARAGFGLAEAATGTTDVRVDGWSLVLEQGRYRARLAGRALDLDLSFIADEPPLLQGRAGLSRKGPRDHHPERPAVARRRSGLAGPRVVQRDSRSLRRGVGLDRPASGRWRRPDGVPGA